MTSKKLHSDSIGIVNGKKYHIDENIVKEMSIQKYLTETDDNCPKSIVKFRRCFERYVPIIIFYSMQCHFQTNIS